MEINLEQILKTFSQKKQNIQSVHQLLKEISNLESKREENFHKLRSRLTKLEKILSNFEMESNIQIVKEWLNKYNTQLNEVAEKYKSKLGIDLEEQLKNIGLELSGHIPELKTSFFTIEVNFDTWKATIWFGPKQEKLKECPLSAQKIAKEIEKLRKNLGSKLEKDEFSEKLHIAYNRVVGNKTGEKAQITKVLVELAFLIQSPRFHQDPKRENFSGYSRADFSFDLYRFRNDQSNKLFKYEWVLRTATRSETTKRSGFLWIPNDEKGNGSSYSYVVFKEGKNEST
ncbi:MAG: hypothetical protein ACPLX7_05905 [Candidatus Kapaibacteriota bacterium]